MMGQRIREARIKKDLKQVELARMIGVEPAEISQYEAGKRTPRWDKLSKLLDALDVSADEIMGREVTVLSEEEGYKIKLAKKDLQIIYAVKNNKKLYTILSIDPERNARVINNNIKEVFPE